MASSGKKGRKNKGTAISLQSFLSNGDLPVGTTQVAKNIRNVDSEDSDDGRNMVTVICQLPTAPRAKRLFDDNSIPHKSPFIAYVTNLPFDVQEEDIYEYFNNNNVLSVRLPREEGDRNRIRGFGYVEFESREDLIHCLGIPDPTIKGRRIRIDLSNENDQNLRQRGPKRNYDLAGNSESREVGNWRRDNNTKRDSYNSNDLKYNSDGNNSNVSWRTKHQSSPMVSSANDQTFSRNHSAGGVVKNSETERPKLLLKPRTLPLPELPEPVQNNVAPKITTSKSTGISAEKVFGSAKPVDTTARDLEMEKRMSDVRRQDNFRKDVVKATNDLGKLSFKKDETDKTSNRNWRQPHDGVETFKNKDKQSDARREYVKESGKKYNDKIERCLDQTNNAGKKKNIGKTKIDSKGDRHDEKNARNLTVNTASVNMYSGLDDDSD